jgi:transcriptional regulator of acetoin/glycerol metabolism
MGNVATRVVVVCECPRLDSGAGETLSAAGIRDDLVDVFSGRFLRMPPLRERIDDLVALIEQHSPACAGRALGRSSFSADAIRHLSAHRWPGNESELRKLLGTLVGRESGDPLRREDLPLDDAAGELRKGRAGGSERERIVDALWRNGFNRTRTAAYLGISRKTLYNKIRRFGLNG